MSIVDKSNYGFFPTYELNKNTIVYNLPGGAQWTGGSVDPYKNILYVTTNEIPTILKVFASRDINKNFELKGVPKTTVKIKKIVSFNCQKLFGKKNTNKVFGLEISAKEIFSPTNYHDFASLESIMKRKKILVTGGLGFIGSNLIKLLLKKFKLAIIQLL